MFAATPATATGKPRLISNADFMAITAEAVIDAIAQHTLKIGFEMMRDG